MSGKPVQRVGDFNSGGGIAVGPGHTNVLINGRPVLIPFTPFTPHLGCNPKKPIHCFGIVAVSGNSKTVLVNGFPMVIAGAKDSCKHARILGSDSVLAI